MDCSGGEEAQAAQVALCGDGIYFCDGRVFEKIGRLRPSWGELEITDVNNMYLEEGTPTHSILEGWWTDAGTFESGFQPGGRNRRQQNGLEADGRAALLRC